MGRKPRFAHSPIAAAPKAGAEWRQARTKRADPEKARRAGCGEGEEQAESLARPLGGECPNGGSAD